MLWPLTGSCSLRYVCLHVQTHTHARTHARTLPLLQVRKARKAKYNRCKARVHKLSSCFTDCYKQMMDNIHSIDTRSAPLQGSVCSRCTLHSQSTDSSSCLPLGATNMIVCCFNGSINTTNQRHICVTCAQVQSVTSLSPVYHQSVINLSPVCHQSVTNLSPVCHQSVTRLVCPVLSYQCICTYVLIL